MTTILRTPLTSVNTSQPPIILLVIICFFPVTARHDIPEAEFPDYVKQMHQDGDKKYNLEFQVSTTPSTGGVMTHTV